MFPIAQIEVTSTLLTLEPGSTEIFSLVNLCGCGLTVGSGALGSGPHPTNEHVRTKHAKK